MEHFSLGLLCLVSGTLKTGESHNSSVRDIFSCSSGGYLHMCVCLHICRFTCVHTHAHGGLRLTSEVFPSSSLSYSLSQGLSLNPEIAD